MSLIVHSVNVWRLLVNDKHRCGMCALKFPVYAPILKQQNDRIHAIDKRYSFSFYLNCFYVRTV